MSIVEFSVQKEYEKLPDLKPDDIKQIRDWLKTQPHLPHMYITDLDIIVAYHWCGCDIELTKRVIDLNYTLRTLFSFYSNRAVDQSLKVACHTWLITPLSTPTFKGHRAVYCHLLDPDTSKFVYGDVIRAFVMILDLWQYEEGTLPELALVVNMDSVTLSHISGIDLTVAQQFFYFLQEAMFIRLREFHFINAPSFVDKLLSIIKPLLKENLLNNLKIHPVGSDTLDEYIPRHALPKEVGGEFKDLATLRDEVWHRLKNNEGFFNEEAMKRVDESKRLGGKKSISSFFPGIDATFKKLSID